MKSAILSTHLWAPSIPSNRMILCYISTQPMALKLIQAFESIGDSNI